MALRSRTKSCTGFLQMKNSWKIQKMEQPRFVASSSFYRMNKRKFLLDKHGQRNAIRSFLIYKDLHLLMPSRKDLSTCHESKVKNKNHFLPRYQRNVYSTASKFPFPPTRRIVYYFSEEIFWKERTTLRSQWNDHKRFWFSQFWFPTSVTGRCRINAKDDG